MFDRKKSRLNRLFNPSGKCLDVAIDHGVFNERSFLNGLEDMEQIVKMLVEAGPDVIQMNYGQADLLQCLPGKTKPALLMRVDVGNPYNPMTHRTMYNVLTNPEEPILMALRMDAAAVVCNLLLLPDEPDLHRMTVQNAARLRNECEKYAMPLMIEPLVMKRDQGYSVDGNKNLIVPLVRQARELGADIIKADPTDHADDYYEVVQAARCPVLVRGGGKADLQEVFQRSYAFLQQGASGLVYGRNVYQHPNPNKLVKALMAMIHEQASVEAALQIYNQ
ncbi:MAG: class I fructose-bisphosphate aldolase [Pirellula sp.]